MTRAEKLPNCVDKKNCFSFGKDMLYSGCVSGKHIYHIFPESMYKRKTAGGKK